MKYRNIIFGTMLFGIILQFVFPSIWFWIPVTITIYIAIGMLFALAKYFHKRDKEQARIVAMLAMLLYIEFFVISVILVFRMLDKVTVWGPEDIILPMIGCGIFGVILSFEPIDRWVG